MTFPGKNHYSDCLTLSRGAKSMMLMVNLNLNTAAQSLCKTHETLAHARAKATSFPSPENITALGEAIRMFFVCLFGPQQSEQLLHFYHDAPAAMLDDLTPYIRQQIIPRIKRRSIRYRRRLEHLARKKLPKAQSMDTAAIFPGNRRYRLIMTYHRIHFLLENLTDTSLLDQDRLHLILRVLIRGHVPTNRDKQLALLNRIRTQLIPSPTPEQSPVMSILQDAPLIHAAFRQVYGINLQQEDLPWQTFCELLAGLPASTRLCEVISLRMRPVPPPDKHNKRYREALIQAKNAVDLHPAPTEKAAALQAGLNCLAQSLLNWAEQLSSGTGCANPMKPEGGESAFA